MEVQKPQPKPHQVEQPGAAFVGCNDLFCDVVTLPRPFYQDRDCVIYHGDSTEIAPLLRGIDALISDPPYGIAYCHGSRKGGRKQGMDGESIVGDTQPFEPRPWLHYPIVVLWGANNYASRLPDNSKWLVWDKRDGVQSNDQADLEAAWTNQKGVARMRTRYWNGAQAKEKDERRLHPNQKPVSLMEWCLEEVAVPEGGIVLDPFAGVGSTLLACKRTGRRSIGIEIEERWCEWAANRLNNEPVRALF